MIYGQISLLIVLIGLCGVVAFLCLRTWNLIDAIKQDHANHSADLRAVEALATAARDAWQNMETTHYSKLAARVAAVDGLVEGWSERQKALVTSVEQMHQRLSSWQRTEGRSARKDGEKAPEASPPADSVNAAITQAIAEGRAVPFSPAIPAPTNRIGKSIRARVA